MTNMYTEGDYLRTTQTWHAEDSPWNAAQVARIITDNNLRPRTIAEIGCGAGQILGELSQYVFLEECEFEGYDISPDAIQLCKNLENGNIKFYCQDLLANNNKHFDILLVVDVIEHVPDYMGFVKNCKDLADYKVYHIPLDIHVSSVMRNAFIRGRYSIGHLHYFTADTALATLQDTGHEVVDFFYTGGAFGLFRQHPSFKKAVANIPRWLFSKSSVPFTARIFGGYSLLVLAK